MGRKKIGSDEAKEKAADKYVLVQPDDQAYRLLGELIPAFHDELAEAKVVLVWEHDVKEDCDGHLVLGRAKKIGPLDHAFHDHDFAILLNYAAWRELPESAKRALLDHELCHCGTKTSDQTGEVSYYLRKHDLEGFDSEVRRHGLWRSNIESFVKAALRKGQVELFDKNGDPKNAAQAAAQDFKDTIARMPGVGSVTLEFGDKSVTLSGGEDH